MHPDRVGVGVDADQETVHGGTAAEAVLHRLLEVLQPPGTTGGGQGVVAAVGGASFMGRIQGTEVV